MMTEHVKGKTAEQAVAVFNRFHAMVVGEPAAGNGTDLGKLQAFAGVRRFPARVKCATLAWHTFKAALESQSDTVTTE